MSEIIAAIPPGKEIFRVIQATNPTEYRTRAQKAGLLGTALLALGVPGVAASIFFLQNASNKSNFEEQAGGVYGTILSVGSIIGGSTLRGYRRRQEEFEELTKPTSIKTIFSSNRGAGMPELTAIPILIRTAAGPANKKT